MVLPYFKRLVFSCLCNRYDRCNILPTRCFTKNSCPHQKKNIHEERPCRQLTTTHIHTCGGRCSVKSEKVCVWRRLGWMDGATGEDIFSHFWEISHFYAKRLSCQNSNRVVYHWLISPRVSQFSPSTLRCLLLCFLCCPFLSSHRVYLNSLSDSCVLFLIWTRIAPVFVVGLLLVFSCRYFGFSVFGQLSLQRALCCQSACLRLCIWVQFFFLKHDAGQSELSRWKYQFGRCLLFL